jgi:hypothetical protein
MKQLENNNINTHVLVHIVVIPLERIGITWDDLVLQTQKITTIFWDVRIISIFEAKKEL